MKDIEKEDIYSDLFDEVRDKTDWRALLFRYLAHWRWIAVSVVVCVAAARIYIYRAWPEYDISATVRIKDDKRGGGRTSAEMSLMTAMGLTGVSGNIEDEIEVMRSKSLVRDVVATLGLYVGYTVSGTLRDTELYDDAPVLVHIAPSEAEALTEPVGIVLDIDTGGVTVAISNGDTVISRRMDKLPAACSTPAGTFTFTRNDDPRYLSWTGQMEAVVGRPSLTALRYVAALSIEPVSKTASVVSISLRDTHRKRGEDFINKLVETYNSNANAAKKLVAENTARFINERIDVIDSELGSTELELETLKRSSGLTNLNNDAQQAVSEKSEYEKRLVDNGTQLKLAGYLADYVASPDNIYTVIPANVGVNDATLTTLIDQYNALILERMRLLRSSSEANPVIQKLNNNIQSIRTNLADAIENVKKSLLITRNDLDRQISLYSGRISNAPRQERQLVSIQRQQEIRAGLYMMLLQKREENNIALTATADNAVIIDEAGSTALPVWPRSRLICLLAIAAGVFLPVLAISVVLAFRFRIEGRDDVERLTDVPVVGDIPLCGHEVWHDTGVPLIRPGENDAMAEAFRGLRTNLLFMLGAPGKKVILVTSSTSGEGKTFISSNLALSLAMLGGRVIVVGLDIRKPGLGRVFGLGHEETGVTHYLAFPDKTDIDRLIRPSGTVPNLDVIICGSIPPNPTELLMRRGLDDLMALLRQRYDYIVLDTAPIGLVADTQVMARVADTSVYVCRAGFTQKDDFRLVNELHARQRMPELCTVLNGLDISRHRYGNYYGYGYGYGYAGNGGKKRKAGGKRHK